MPKPATYSILIIYCLLIAATSAFADCESVDQGGAYSIAGNYTYSQQWYLQWDPSNPTAMDSAASVELTVIGGWPPFTWSATNGVFYDGDIPTHTITTDARNVSFYADEIDCETEEATITVADSFGSGSAVGGQVAIQGSASDIAWNYSASCQTIDQDGSCAVSITGGTAPFSWQITEGAAYFNAERDLTAIETAAPAVTIYADGACGAIEITITDQCGRVEVGYVRAPGKWIYAGEGCVCPDGLPNPCGKYKQIQETCKVDYYQIWGRCADATYPDWNNKRCEMYGPYCHDEFAAVPCRKGVCYEATSAYCPGEICRYWRRCNYELYYQEWVCP